MYLGSRLGWTNDVPEAVTNELTLSFARHCVSEQLSCVLGKSRNKECSERPYMESAPCLLVTSLGQPWHCIDANAEIATSLSEKSGCHINLCLLFTALTSTTAEQACKVRSFYLYLRLQSGAEASLDPEQQSWPVPQPAAALLCLLLRPPSAGTPAGMHCFSWHKLSTT